MEYGIRKISAPDIHIIKELWEELNRMRYEKSDTSSSITPGRRLSGAAKNFHSCRRKTCLSKPRLPAKSL